MDEDQKRDLIEQLSEMIQRRIEISVNDRLRAVAQATRNLADGLSNAEERHTKRDEEFQETLIAILGAIDRPPMTAEQLADKVPHTTICAARLIQFKRGSANKELAPLPPVPVDGEGSETLTVRHHTEITKDARKEDDSIVFHTQDGKAHIRANIKAKTLAGWVFGLITFGLAAWHIIAEHVAKGGH